MTQWPRLPRLGKLDAEELEDWVRLAFPVYTRTRKDPLAGQRAIRRPEVNFWFARPGGEGRTFNFFPALPNIQCPTLVLGGEDYPMIPIECQEDLVAALPAHLARFERFSNCGHSVIADAPHRAFAIIRDFIAQ
jgi:pimeloyl-ACP methyl ester carboxylesterase